MQIKPKVDVNVEINGSNKHVNGKKLTFEEKITTPVAIPLTTESGKIPLLPREYGHTHILRYKDMKNCPVCGEKYSFFKPPKICNKCGQTSCAPCSEIKYYEWNDEEPTYYCYKCAETDEVNKCPVCLNDWKEIEKLEDKEELKKQLEQIENSIKILSEIEYALRSSTPVDLSPYHYLNRPEHGKSNDNHQKESDDDESDSYDESQARQRFTRSNTIDLDKIINPFSDDVEVMLQGTSKFDRKASVPSSKATYQIEIKKGTDLVSKDANGYSDPFCRFGFVTYDGILIKTFKTKVIKKNLNPVWNHTQKVECPAQAAGFLLQVWDKDLVGDDFMGEVKFVPEKDGFFNIKGTYKLQSKYVGKRVSGTVTFSVQKI